MTEKRLLVTHNYETEIDVDRLDEWVEANYPEGQLQIQDPDTGEMLYDRV